MVQSKLIPKLAPDLDIEVILPVPTLYPIKKIPGNKLAINLFSLFIMWDEKDLN